MRLKVTIWLCLGLWALPIVRCARFAKWAADGYSSEGSINAANDLDYAKAIGLCYGVGIISSLLLCWLLGRRHTAVNWTLWLLCLGCVMAIIVAKPEEPIVLFPSFSPLRWGIWLLALGAIGVASHADSSNKTVYEASPNHS